MYGSWVSWIAGTLLLRVAGSSDHHLSSRQAPAVGDPCPNLPNLRVCSAAPLQCAAVCCYDGPNFVGQCNAGDTCYRAVSGQWSCCPAGRTCGSPAPAPGLQSPPPNPPPSTFSVSSPRASPPSSSSPTPPPSQLPFSTQTSTQLTTTNSSPTSSSSSPSTVMGKPLQANLLSAFAFLPTSVWASSFSSVSGASQSVGSSILTLPPPTSTRPSSTSVMSAWTTAPPSSSAIPSSAQSSISTMTGSPTVGASGSVSMSVSMQSNVAAARETGWRGVVGVGVAVAVGVLGGL